MFDHVKSSVQVGLHHLFKILFLHGKHQRIPHDARIIDQDIDAAKLLDHLCNRLTTALAAGYITADAQRLPSQLPNLVASLLGCLFAAQI